MIDFELTYTGSKADDGLLEFYDASQALAGFQRSLALTTHLVLHGEILVKAPAVYGFEIYLPPFQEGSWKAKAKIAIVGAFMVASVGKDSPVGHVVTSVYDYALKTTMGFHVDYDQTLQSLYAANNPDTPISAAKLDSLCEKIESSVADMHRPIVASKSADFAQVSRCADHRYDIGPLMSPLTYDYVKQTKRDDETVTVVGYVSSYNINTYQGRIYSIEEGRPIPFELEPDARHKETVSVLTVSQHYNGQSPFDERALVTLVCERLVSVTGKVKRYVVSSAKAGA